MEQVTAGDTTATLDSLVSDLEGYIREALDILDSGEYVELNGLDEKVTALCQRITVMPISEARDFRPKLTSITKQLDLLQTIMMEHRDRIEQQLQGLDTKKRATQAYAKSEAMAPVKRPLDAE